MSCLDLTCCLHIGINCDSGKIFRIQFSLPSGHADITETIIRELRLHNTLCSIRNINKLRFGRTIVLIIKVIILKNLSKIQYDFRSLWLIGYKRNIAGKVLSKVKHCLPDRCVDHFFHSQLLHLLNRKAVTLHQCSLSLCEHCILQFIFLILPEQVVLDLSIINVTRFCIGAFVFPCLIGSDHLSRSILTGQVDFRDHLETAAEIFFLAAQSETSLIPSISKFYLNLIFPFDLICNIKGQVLDLVMIITVIRSQHFFTDFSSI